MSKEETFPFDLDLREEVVTICYIGIGNDACGVVERLYREGVSGAGAVYVTCSFREEPHSLPNDDDYRHFSFREELEPDTSQIQEIRDHVKSRAEVFVLISSLTSDAIQRITVALSHLLQGELLFSVLHLPASTKTDVSKAALVETQRQVVKRSSSFCYITDETVNKAFAQFSVGEVNRKKEELIARAVGQIRDIPYRQVEHKDTVPIGFDHISRMLKKGGRVFCCYVSTSDALWITDLMEKIFSSPIVEDNLIGDNPTESITECLVNLYYRQEPCETRDMDILTKNLGRRLGGGKPILYGQTKDDQIKDKFAVGLIFSSSADSLFPSDKNG